ncbi:UNVERIFIED_CONTAM: hypothetical protein GTU68_026488 [Idotea baltica]|nr:hypothetical protein [Idotea baltica]
MSDSETTATSSFLEEIIANDLESGKHDSVQLRFPPEPNGYLHIGHAKSICLNFGLAQKFGGKCNLRFDDTNPVKENVEFVDNIQKDIQWLGFQWDGDVLFSSDYFQQLYDWAVELIKGGHAYVDDSTAEEIAKHKGTPTRPGAPGPNRDRSVEENLSLFEAMKNGEYQPGDKVLRAKIDLASPNMHLRDPLLYRIINHPHHRTGDQWKVYPMYDWAHGQSDSIESITHSLCTLEFEVHRPLYDWFIQALELYAPRQYEFSRFNMNYCVMSKRKLRLLVEDGHVDGWDDPRMITLAGLRRRGYTAASIRNLMEGIGVTRVDSITDMSKLEFSIRDDLNKTAPRVMAVLKPLKVVVTNWPEDKVEQMEVENNPEDPNGGTRTMPFSRELYIERDDFLEDAPRKYFRLAPGREVRFKGAFILKCEDFIKDENGEVVELHCTYDPETRSGQDTSGKKVKGTIHWVSAKEALDVEVRIYDRLFTEGEEYHDFLHYLNPNSLEVNSTVKAEPSLASAKEGDTFQFMRKGYFVVDRDSTEGHLVFNRTVAMRDSWKKKNKR